MMERIIALPLLEAMALLFVIVMCRANATYWVGRGIAAGVIRSGLLSRHRGAGRRAEQLISRWGVLAVPLSFLTIGLQTALNGTAGALRMPLRRYLPAVVVGSILWAFLYATAGLAAFSAGLALAARSPWLLAAAIVLVLAVVATVVLWRRRTRRVVGLATGAIAPDEGPEDLGLEASATSSGVGSLAPTTSMDCHEDSSTR